MKFAIACSDRYQGVFDAFLARGWEPLKLFTAPVDQRLHKNRSVIDLASRLRLDIQLSRLTERDLNDLAARGCQVLIVASYPWRIGDWRPHLDAAINFHPSPLPLGRGPEPLVPALLRGYREWGVSCHRIEHEFDAGALLGQRHFPLAADECRESLDLKVQMACAGLAGEIADDFGASWDNACPQGPGDYFAHWQEDERRLDLTRPLPDLLRQLRAFGTIECQARINDVEIQIRRAVGWEEAHTHPPGRLVHSSQLQMVVAVPGGYLGIIEWSLLHADAVTGSDRR